MTRRTERIGEQLRGELARLLRDEVSDPRVGIVTLTRVDVSPDLAQALVFWSPLDRGDDRGEEALETIADGLHSAASFLRRRVAQCLALRRSPALDFRHDPSIELAAETLDLLREVSMDAPVEPASGEGDHDG